MKKYTNVTAIIAAACTGGIANAQYFSTDVSRALPEDPAAWPAGRTYYVRSVNYQNNGWGSCLHGFSASGDLRTSTYADFRSKFYGLGWVHGGVDYMSSLNNPAYSVGYGQVMHVKDDSKTTMNESQVVIKHRSWDGTDFYITYGHVKRVNSIAVGTLVNPGQQIGLVMSYNGPHIHFEVNTTFKTTWGSYTAERTREPLRFFVDKPSGVPTSFNSFPDIGDTPAKRISNSQADVGVDWGYGDRSGTIKPGTVYRLQISKVSNKSSDAKINGYTTSRSAGGNVVVNHLVAAGHPWGNDETSFIWDASQVNSLKHMSDNVERNSVSEAPQVNTTYYWRVYAHHPEMGTSYYSPEQSFRTIGTAPATRTAVSPLVKNDITHQESYFNFTITSSTDWTAQVSDPSWILLSRSSGYGSLTGQVTIRENTSTSPRSGTISVGSCTMTITQAGTTASTTLNRSSISFPGTGGTETVTVSSNQNWSVTKNNYLLQTSRSSGSGNGSVVITCAPNPRDYQITGQVIIGGQIVSVTIAAAPTTYTNISSASQTGISEYGTQYGISVSSNQNWATSSDQSWARVSSRFGTGNGNLTVTVDRNTTSSSRSATIWIGPKSHTLTQNAASAFLTIAPPSSQVSASGGTVSVSVSTNQSYSVNESSSWLSWGASGNTVYLYVAANPNTTSRSAIVTIGNLNHTVTQAGASPSIAVSPTSHTIASTGGSYSLQVQSNTTWSASSDTSWARVPNSGVTGNSYLTVQCDANYSTSARYANISVGGQIHRLTQSGASTSSSGVSNDLFRNAYPLSGSSVARSGNSNGSTVESDEKAFTTDEGRTVYPKNTVWFKWSPASSGYYYVATKGSAYDTVLGVYTGSSVSTVTQVAANDDKDGAQSRVYFYASSSQTYYISIGAYYQNQAGSYSLQIGRNLSSGTVYATSFETNEGFTLNSDLIGVNGWTGEGTAGSGILSGYMAGEGQQAFVGYSAGVTEDSLLVSRPVNHVPVMSEMPRAVFSVKMQITDSTNLGYDDFKWTAYNTEGHALFSLNFDNYNTTIGYTLDGSATNNQPTEVSFENGKNYDLVVTMDFATNTWSATIDGSPLVSDQPISVTGALMTLGKIDASWAPQVPEFPGDNRMIFDNYKIEELESRNLSFTTQMAETGAMTVILGETIHLTSPDDGNPTRTYQWRFNGLDIAGAIEPALFIENADSTQTGSYTVVITDGENSQEGSPVIVTVVNHTNAAFGNWLSATFNNGEGVEIAGAYADADGDGISNFGEYALGGDPESSASAPRAVLVNPTSTGHDLEFFRLVSPEGVRYAIELSTDLSEWIEDASATIVPDSLAPAPSGYERVKVTMPRMPENNKAFYRVRALIE